MTEQENRKLIDELRQEVSKSQVASTAVLEETRREIAVIKVQVIAFEKALLERVQKLEFLPVKLIAYGLAAGTLTTVLGAVLQKVFLK